MDVIRNLIPFDVILVFKKKFSGHRQRITCCKKAVNSNPSFILCIVPIDSDSIRSLHLFLIVLFLLHFSISLTLLPVKVEGMCDK